MELRHLETFLAVARDASFTRAAESLHLTQPAVTRQIATLEAELRTRLFDRLGKSIRLTASGEALRGYAEQTLRLEREARAAVAEIADGSAGRITLGAASTLAAYILPPVLARFRRAHPRVTLSLRTGLSAQVRDRVLDGSVDIGLATTEGLADPVDEPLASRGLGPYETVLVTPPGHALARVGRARIQDLEGADLVAMESGTNLRAFADRALAAAGVGASVALELDSVEAIKRMVEAGLGLALLPRVAVTAEAQAGRLAAVPLEGLPPAPRQMVALWRRDRYVGGALQAFLDLLAI